MTIRHSAEQRPFSSLALPHPPHARPPERPHGATGGAHDLDPSSIEVGGEYSYDWI